MCEPQGVLSWKVNHSQLHSLRVSCSAYELFSCRSKIKRNRKMDKYQDLAREIKKLWNWKETVILMIDWASETIAKNLLNRMRDEKSQEELRLSRQQHWWDWLEYLEESWRAEKTCCHLIFSENHSLLFLLKKIMT